MLKFFKKYIPALVLIILGVLSSTVTVYAVSCTEPDYSSSTRSEKSPIIGSKEANNFGNVQYDWASDDSYVITPPEPYIDDNDLLHGDFWSENIGWMTFDHNDPGRRARLESTADPNIMLMQGSAWSENVGWVDYHASDEESEYVYLDVNNGIFHGNGWSENIGWLTMDDDIQVDIKTADTDDIILVGQDIVGAKEDQIFKVTFSNDGGSPLKNGIVRVEKWNRSPATPWDRDNPATYNEFTATANPLTLNGVNIRDVDVLGANGMRIYNMNVTITDNAGNISSKDMCFGVVSGEYDPENSEIVLDTDTGPKTADNTDYYSFANIELRDIYSNTIQTIIGLKNVNVELNFTNNNDLNQMPFAGNLDLGDATRFIAGVYGIDLTLVNQIILDGLMAPAAGVYSKKEEGKDTDLRVYSYTPTSDQYGNTTSPNIINIDNILLNVSVGSGYTGIGETGSPFNLNSLNDKPTNFAFQPLLTNNLIDFPTEIIERLIYDYNIEIKNLSVSEVSVNNIDVLQNCYMNDATVECYLWDKEEEAAEGEDNFAVNIYSLVSQGLSHYFALTPVDRTFAAFFSSYAGATSDTREERMSITVLGGDVMDGTKLTLETELGYKVGEKTVYHPGSGVDNISVKSGSLEIKGRVRSDVVGSLNGNVVNNVGDVRMEALITSIYREVGSIVRGSDIDGGRGIGSPLTSWDDSTHSLLNDKVFYYKNGDVYLGQIDGTFTVPAGRHTIIVEGGDLFIQSDIKYEDKTSSLGIIVLKDDSSEGDTYIHPNVTDLVGIWYVDGSVYSWKPPNKEAFDGNNVTAGDLQNQLYFKGTIVSHNTLGGSSKKPPELPVGLIYPDSIKTLPDSVREGVMSKYAQKFDFKYLRFYIKDKGGEASPNTDSDASTVLEFAPDLLTAEKVPDGFRGGIGVATEER